MRLPPPYRPPSQMQEDEEQQEQEESEDASRGECSRVNTCLFVFCQRFLLPDTHVVVFMPATGRSVTDKLLEVILSLAKARVPINQIERRSDLECSS